MPDVPAWLSSRKIRCLLWPWFGSLDLWFLRSYRKPVWLLTSKGFFGRERERGVGEAGGREKAGKKKDRENLLFVERLPGWTNFSSSPSHREETTQFLRKREALLKLAATWLKTMTSDDNKRHSSSHEMWILRGIPEIRVPFRNKTCYFIFRGIYETRRNA